MTEPIRIGSRGSQLALWQANYVAGELRTRGHAVEIEVIRTTGDRLQHAENEAAASAGGAGIFVKEIEEALAEGRIDMAVHSLKDLPTQSDPRFVLAAIPPRADARDAWVCEPYWALHTLPEGGRIGTTSPRRKAQILALRPDVSFVEIRGNVDTRLRRLAEGGCDALVLACAGLDRLGRTESVHARFATDELCPAPGQGALAVETRAAEFGALSSPERDESVRRAVAALDDAETRFCVETERIVLHALGGGCLLPIGAFCSAVRDGARTLAWHVHAQVVAADGERVVTASASVGAETSAERLGLDLAAELEARGALDLLAEFESSNA